MQDMGASAELKFNTEGFTYESETGFIFWLGRRADTKGGRYRKVTHFGVQVYAHRLAWRLYYGEWPPSGMTIDHVNHNKHENRIRNLRLATQKQNNANKIVSKNSKSGELGVHWCSIHNRWRVAVCNTRLYTFYASHKISAILASRLIRRVLHGEFAP